MRFCTFTSALILIGTSAAYAQMSSHAPTVVAKSTAAVTAPAAVDDKRPVARVNGTVLTERDLMRELYTIFPYAAQHNGIPKKMEPEMRKGALAMIEFEELVYQEALRRKMDIPPSAMKDAIGQIRARFTSQKEFDNFVQTQFGSQQALHEKVRRSLLIDKLLRQEVTEKSVIKPADLKAYYDANPKKFEHPESFSFQSISIIPPQNPSPEVRKEAAQRAQDALKSAKATKSYKDFGLLAEKISDDDWHVDMGDRKSVDRAVLPPDVVKALLSLKPGEVSDLIQLGPNYTIVRLNTHTPAGRAKFEEVKAQLQQDLAKAKSEQVRAKFDQHLRQNAKVEEL